MALRRFTGGLEQHGVIPKSAATRSQGRCACSSRAGRARHQGKSSSLALGLYVVFGGGGQEAWGVAPLHSGR